MTLTAPLVTPEQHRQLEDDGYFITPVLFDEPTLEGVRAEFNRLWAEHVEATKKHGDARDVELQTVRAFFSGLEHRSTICREFLRHESMAQLCRELLGPDADRGWNQAICKAPLPKGDNTFAWHQDMQYALSGDYAKDTNRDILMNNHAGITVWVAITRTTVDNGTLWVLPGRHKEGLLPHEWSKENREWVGQYDTSWRVPAVMRAGQALVLRKWLPHASGPNISNEVRMAYQIGYSLPGFRTAPSKEIEPLIRGGKRV